MNEIEVVFNRNNKGTMVDENLVPKEEDGRPITHLLDSVVDGLYVVDEEYYVAEELKAIEQARKDEGEMYTKENGEVYKVSFQKDDADGVLQVKSAFELGLSSTTIHFENGTKMPITASEFGHFALWFVEKRNSFFVGGN